MSTPLDKLRIDKDTLFTESPRRRRFWLIAIPLLALLVIIVAYGLRNRGVTVETTAVATVYPTQGFTVLNASGYLVAQRKAAVASKITGRLEWLGVEEGSRVTAGQVLARLENQDLAASLEQARAARHNAEALVEQAKAEQDDAERAFRRQSELIAQGIVARADYDLAEARHRRAVAGVRAASAQVNSTAAAIRGAETAYEYSRIRAPFNGVVLTKNADVGDIITPLGAAATSKSAVVTLADLSSLQVEADVSESSLSQVRTGQPCEVTLDALPGVRLRGVVHTIVPTADRTKASVMVKVRFLEPDPRMLPEMSAKVAFLSRQASADDQKPRRAVLAAAVIGNGKDAAVLVIKDGRARRQPVSVGQKLGDLVVVEGVANGVQLVLRPLDKVKDGTRVVVKDR
jgi:RND family efflux transporter MFP subunit